LTTESHAFVETPLEHLLPQVAPLVGAYRISRRSAGARGWLLDDVSLSICVGDRLALRGPAGAGKTLLLRALAALDPLDTGNIVWRGRTLTAAMVPDYRSQVIYLHQRPALRAGTVADNLQWPFKLRAFRDRQFDSDRMLGMLASVGREPDFLNRRCRELSGGECQLVALFRALQLDPAILLLDEPTSALDAEMRQAVEALVSQWLARKPLERATLWVTHDGEQAARVADRALTMRDGRLFGGADNA
jgi:putative ABC transport system ATP-binding protein